MSRQDRQGARTPAGLEQKYNFGRVFSDQKKTEARQDSEMSRQSMTMREFILYASAEIDKLHTELDAANQQIVALQEADTVFDEETAKLEQRLSTAEGTITSQGEKITAAEGEIRTHGERITSAEGTITSHGERLTNTEGSLSSQGERLLTSEQTLSDHTQRITEAEGDISALEGRVTTLENAGTA